MTLRYVDVQCFGGAFTLAATQAGFELQGKRERPGAFGALNVLAQRHLLGDKFDVQISEPGIMDGSDWVPVNAELVVSNPPCSGFSLLSSSAFRGKDSPINICMWATIRYAARVRPEVVIFESVQQAYNMKAKDGTRPGRELMRALRDELERLTGDKWGLWHVLHNNASLGGAALRKRYFFVASRVPFGVERVKLDRVPTFGDLLTDLTGLGITWERQPYRSPPSWWSKTLRDPVGGVDGHQLERSPTLGRIMDLARDINWPQGANMTDVSRAYFERWGRLPSSFDYKTSGGMSKAMKLLETDFWLGINQPTRWRSDLLARVITGGACHLVVHPWEDRTLTHREAARIQGFPDTWRIRPLRDAGNLGPTWGKGIPVQSGRWICTWARHAIEGNPGGYVGASVGDREWLIDVTDDWLKVPADRRPAR